MPSLVHRHSLSQRMCALLSDHLDDNPVPIIAPENSKGNDPRTVANRYLLTIKAVHKGFLYFVGPGAMSPRPRFTKITNRGRQELAFLLADEADRLVGARQPTITLPRRDPDIAVPFEHLRPAN